MTDAVTAPLALDQTAFPAPPVFPANAVMVLPMATALPLKTYEREAVLGVLATAAAEAKAWRAVGIMEFVRIARRGVPPFLLAQVLRAVPLMAKDGLVVLSGEGSEKSIAPAPALARVLELEGVHRDYTLEADRLDVEGGEQEGALA